MKMVSPLGGDNFMGIILTTKKPYDRQKLLKAIVPDAVEKKAGDKVYYVPKDSQSHFGQRLHFIDVQRFLLLQEMPGDNNPKAMEKLFDTLYKKKEKGPLTDVIASAQEQFLVMGVHISEDLRKFIDQIGGGAPLEEFSWLQPLLQLQVGSVTAEMGQATKIHFRFRFPDAGKAKDADEAIKHGLKYLKEQLEGPIAEIQDKAAKSKNPNDWCHPAVKLLQVVEAALKTAQVQMQDNVVNVTLTIKTDDAVVEQFAKLVIALREKEKKRGKAQQNLQQIGIAMHNYHAVDNHLPPPAVCDKNGKPLLSWRVMILPYLEQNELYNQFKLDEPWDSDHNKKLLAKMPAVYRQEQLTPADTHLTYYKVFVSAKREPMSAVFVEKDKITLGQLTTGDGTSNTFMVIEGGEPVPWTKPEDIPFDVKKPLPDLEKHFPHGWHALFCDGTVRKIKKGAAEKLLKQLITWNGGENEDYSSIFAADE